jgi:5-methylthioadenosine/S-adenosylhomocysteine deaminase
LTVNHNEMKGTSSEMYDLIIHSGMVLTVNPGFDIINDGVICINDGVIARVEARKGPISNYSAHEIIDAAGGIIMPGLVNAHAHLSMSIFRGLADDLPLADWLNHHVFPAERAHMRPETVRIGTLLSCAEMLLSGTTSCCDGYFHEDVVAAAVAETGLRAVLGQGVIDYPAPGVPDPGRNIDVASEFAVQWRDRFPRLTSSIFCHSPYTCSEKTLKAAKAAARKHNVLFQIHVAETEDEMIACRLEHGISPVAYLDSLGILDEQTLIIHGIWVEDEDLEILAKKKAPVAHCPESSMKLAAGVAPVPQMLKKGITVGLGTDGCASNNNLDLFGEMDSAAKLHKVVQMDPTVMNAETVIRMATIDGARAIGTDRITGSIETGKQADIIILDTHQPHLVPMYHPESHIVYAARGADVRHVLVSGEILIRDFKAVRLDIGHIMSQAREIARRVQARRALDRS